MKNKKLIFVSAYCQNNYQEERIKEFVNCQDSKIINSSFNTKGFNSIENNINKISSKEMNSISKSDEVWILIGSLDSNLPENKLKMHKVEEYSTILNKPLKYIYLYQSGIYTGKTKSIDKKEIFNSDFYKYLHMERE